MLSRLVFRCVATTVSASTSLMMPVVAGAQSRLMDHAVFAKYPTVEELQRRVEQFAREHPGDFRTALEDFDLAVRTTLDLVVPDVVGRPRPIVVRRWILDFPNTRSEYERWTREARQTPGGEGRAEFFERHVDELSFELTPALRYVLVDVLLSGWDDWSGWKTERLREYRRRYPDVHQVAAANLLMRLDIYESEQRRQRGAPAPAEKALNTSGAVLRMLVDPRISYELRKQVSFNVGNIRKDVDALDFVVKAYLATNDSEIRYQCGVRQTLSESLSAQARLDFWLPYLTHPDLGLRTTAVIHVGNSRRRPRDVRLADHPDREIVQLLRHIAQSDPDERVRQRARQAIHQFEDDSPPPGLITYEKEEK